MPDKLNIMQINIRGLISPDTLSRKCPQLFDVIQSKQIDIVLLQEWSATKREEVFCDHGQTQFPIKYFPQYRIHYHSTECAILYHKDLCITPLQKHKEYETNDHRQNFHVCGIVLHSGYTDYGIYLVYRPQRADPTQIFEHPFECDKHIIGGDFNIHHQLWGSKNSCAKGKNFVNLLTESNLVLLNNKTATRVDPRNKTETAIDLTLITPNVKNTSWSIKQYNHDPHFSDHYNIFVSITLNNNPDEQIYHSTWNLTSETKWKNYKKSISKKLNNTPKFSNPNEFVQNITDAIYDTAIETIGYRKYRRGYKPWWNNKINNLKRSAKKLLRKINDIKKKFPKYYQTIPKYNRMLLEYKSTNHHKIQ